MQPHHLIEGTAYCDSIDMKQARILQHLGAVGTNKIEALYISLQRLQRLSCHKTNQFFAT